MTNEEKRDVEDCCKGRRQTATISEYCSFFKAYYYYHYYYYYYYYYYFVINLKQDIYNYMPATNHVSTVYCYSCSVLTIFATCSVMSDIESFHYYLFVITVMYGIYIYIAETNHTTRVHSSAAVLYLQYVLHEMLFRMLNIFCTFTLVLSAVRMQCTKWPFFFLCFLDFVFSWFVAQVLCE